MKKIVSIVTLALVLALTLSLFAPAFAASATRTVTFNLALRQNTLWALYGVDVYLDGQKIVHLDQGDLRTVTAALSDGQHSFEVRGTGSDYSYNYTVGYMNSLLDGDVMNITLQTHEYWIEFKSATRNGTNYSMSTEMNDASRLIGDLITWFVA